jgi:hypothetical protein
VLRGGVVVVGEGDIVLFVSELNIPRSRFNVQGFFQSFQGLRVSGLDETMERKGDGVSSRGLRKQKSSI